MKDAKGGGRGKKTKKQKFKYKREGAEEEDTLSRSTHPTNTPVLPSPGHTAHIRPPASGEGAAIPTTSGNRAVGPSAAGDGAVNRPASSAQEPVPKDIIPPASSGKDLCARVCGNESGSCGRKATKISCSGEDGAWQDGAGLPPDDGMEEMQSGDQEYTYVAISFCKK